MTGDSARSEPTRPAELVWAEDSQRDQAQVAAALHERGVRTGDRVVVSAPASGALLALVLGALRAGVIPVVLDPALPAAQRAALVADAEPALDVGTEPGALLVGSAAARMSAFPLGRPMHYTSGTTGRRKGVWTGVLDEADARALAADEIGLWRLAPEDRHLVLSPLHHSAPLRFATHTLLAGGSVLIGAPFDAAAAAGLISAGSVTTMFCVPTHLQRLLGPGRDPAVDWTSMRLIAHAGAPCPEPVKRALLRAAPPDSVWEFYGSTEAQFTVCSGTDWLARPGTVGRARSGRRLEVDARGQLWTSVPTYARFEYWRDPDKTARSRREPDWITVGDVGRLDADGFAYLDGRREDLIISGGVNVYPAEVEAVLDAHSGVGESAVVGVEDDRWGQRVVAVYLGAVEPGELADWARDRLEPAKRPKSLHRLDELPRTSTGKLRRLDLPGILGMG